MKPSTSASPLFSDYFNDWVATYKEGAIRLVTMKKYRSTQHWIKTLAPSLHIGEITRIAYQKLLNDYAQTHERQTTLDFHHQLKGAMICPRFHGQFKRLI